MTGRAQLRGKLETMPAEPGVYVFRDGRGTVIYVGKAKSLRDRVRSYFTAPEEWDHKGEALRADIADLEVTVCGSEIDALILESTLIKRFQPRYNIMLRDDKSYPYIAVTLSDEFPRAMLTRGKRARGTRYYGPYISVRAAKSTLALLKKVCPLRHCPGSTPGRGGRQATCLYAQMKMCMGPCSGQVDPAQYRAMVKSFCDFLEGRYERVLQELDQRMREASRLQQYEEAARLRNQLQSARQVVAHSRALSSSLADYDLIGMLRDETQAAFAVAQNRGGMHLGNLVFFTDLPSEIADDELVSEFLKRYYDQAGSIPAQVLVPACADEPALCDWLSTQRGSRVTVKVPRKGKKVREMTLATANAGLALEGSKTDWARDKAKVDTALLQLNELLSLEHYPLRIECFDISTMGGAASVGSMVVFQDGLPDRKSYRKFSMKFTPGVDDVGMMKEVLYRRFKRLQQAEEEDAPETREVGFARRPDLLVLDGGKGQLGAALEVLRVLGIEGIEVAALAKRLEEVYRPGARDAILLPRGSEALFLMQRLRDEAHRVAVEYHRSLMRKGTASSWLDGVAGVGPTRKKALIRHFGSPRRLLEADLDAVEAVPGVTAPVALAVFEAARKVKGEVVQ